MGKRILVVAGIIALLLLGGLTGAWLWGQDARPVKAQTSDAAADYSPAQIITVVGQGTARVEPDIAQVSIGVETSAETIGEAVAENKVRMDAILQALTGAGIAEKDIQTMNYSIQLDRYPEPMPRTDASEGEPKPLYRVSNMVTVTIRDLEKAGEVLDIVVEAGANNIWGISFSLEDPATAQADARAKAMTDAQARAEALAELSSVKLGPVMSISEVVSGNVVSPMMAVERAAAAGGSISPGELEIGYQVQVSYFIER
jgi:uncharacterized protein YggE